jgi:pimeloyl-ACP methyl ester carboxylesterase
MNNKLHIFFTLFTLVFCGNTLSSQTAKRDTGTLNGALYEIKIPANWNKKLVMYAHGYEFPNTPHEVQSPNPMFDIFLSKGFAVARSTYSRSGWALPEGIDETEALRKFFVKKYGKTDSTFITGHSMGGGVTVTSIEKFPAVYNGGLALCPLSSRAYVQTKTALDGYVVFNALFPDLLPKITDVMSGKAPSVFTGDFNQKMYKAYEIIRKIKYKDHLLEVFAQHQGVKVEELPFSLAFTDGILRDIAAQTGGNPYDNTNTFYSGYPNDIELNQKVERVAATSSNQRLTTYDRTGIIDKPLLMMHTTYDQLISPQFGIVNYDNLVHEKGKEKNLKAFFTDGQGHCNFTNEQTATAFEALRAWAKSGKKPTEVTLPSPPMVQKDTLCYELRVYWTHPSKLNDLMKRFRNHTTKLFEKHGMTNVGYWTPLDNPDGKLYYVLSYPNRAARDASWKNFMTDTTWQRVAKESEVNGKIVSKVESVFLKTTDFSPNNFTSSNNGVWEFRIYTATPNNLDNLLQRFRGFTVNRFAQYDMGNKAYWTATDAEQGSDKMLYYFLTHPSEEAAKAAFDKFRSDPEWIETRKASEVKGGGSLTVKVESIFMVATDFSKLK